MGKKEEKTNVMRLLDSRGIDYEAFQADNVALDAVSLARAIGIEPAVVFKTLVTVGKSGEYYVFMLPSICALDLKKAAKAAGEKSIEMLPERELLPLTGYVHGGCSPIGMKKELKTFIEQSAERCTRICFSAGKIGRQVYLTLSDLRKVMDVESADVAK